jgi:hypothetical protein
MPPQPLSRTLHKITGKAMGRKMAALASLLGGWETIAGKNFAAVSIPVKLARNPQAPDLPAILHIAAPSAWKTEFQHEAPQLIARINAFFGYKAVGALRLSARSLPAKTKPVAAARHSALNSADIEAKVADIEDPALKAALIRLGQAMGAR